jgi:hypothetical protein
MSDAGQREISDFVENGGGMVTGEWFIWSVNSRFASLSPLAPVEITNQFNTASNTTYTQVTPDPIINRNLPASITFNLSNINGSESVFSPREGATNFYSSSNGGGISGSGGVVGWKYGEGKVVSFSTTIGNTEMADVNYAQLFKNAVQWAEGSLLPAANAGPDKIICNQICDKVVLDGRKSQGEIVSYEWILDHDDNSCDQTAPGETPTVSALCPGAYTVTLTITDDDGFNAMDEMKLTVLETCDPCAIMQGDFDSDGDVDGDDMRIFSGHFGQNELLIP